jgi:hypothetical protein
MALDLLNIDSKFKTRCALHPPATGRREATNTPVSTSA